VSVEDGSDELWVAVKCQSNLEIAGSPRNALRCSLGLLCPGGRALDGRGALPGYRSQPNSECRRHRSGSETVGDKLHGQKGNSPDPLLRSQSPAQWKRMWERADNQDVGLEAATIERVRNSLLVDVFLRRQFNGAMPDTEARDLVVRRGGRGAFAVQRSRLGTDGGALRSEDAGISSEKTGENPVRRKPKVS
jgi:hypothetical protein